MNIHEFITEEIDQALSDVNKYYFWLHYGRQHDSVEELLQYYVDSGGAAKYAQEYKEKK